MRNWGPGGSKMRHFVKQRVWMLLKICQLKKFGNTMSSSRQHKMVDISADSGWVEQYPCGLSLGGPVDLRTVVGWGSIHADSRWEGG